MKTNTTDTHQVSMIDIRESFTPKILQPTYFFGHSEAHTVFGELIAPCQEVSLILSQEKIKELAKDHIIMYQIPLTVKAMIEVKGNKIGKDPILYKIDWYKDEYFYVEEKARSGIYLKTKELIPHSKGENLLTETGFLAKHLGEVFRDIAMPEKFKEAIDEYEREYETLGKLINKDLQEANKQIHALLLNKLCRPTFSEEVQKMVYLKQRNEESILSNSYSRTNSCSSDGSSVRVGRFTVAGAGGGGWDPKFALGRLGVSFSLQIGVW